jgi:hypothetical protein
MCAVVLPVRLRITFIGYGYFSNAIIGWMCLTSPMACACDYRINVRQVNVKYPYPVIGPPQAKPHDARD